MKDQHKIAVIGLGYVGLPLARLFATKYPVVGFDINQQRIAELNEGNDLTLEVADDVLQEVLVKENPLNTQVSSGLYCSSNLEDIQEATIYVITVPTPVDKHNRPDLTPLYKSSETVGNVLKKGDIVIYESTVYPGVTEEECVPVLERVSGLQFNEDFFAGYSPERINPGDKNHTVEKILKVTSGSTPEIGKIVDALYRSVITAGTHLAPTIKVAEASKVIENSQRDINIAFVNELAKIFSLMDIDTQDVLAAARTKWNFLPFQPGLVGGHCIGVDPFYLAQKAQEIGYYSELILTSRRLNDSMGPFIASQVIKLMIQKDIKIKEARVLNLGITFKENCPDIRNSKAIDVIEGMKDYGAVVEVYDPWANPTEVLHEYGIHCHSTLDSGSQTNGHPELDSGSLISAHPELDSASQTNGHPELDSGSQTYSHSDFVSASQTNDHSDFDSESQTNGHSDFVSASQTNGHPELDSGSHFDSVKESQKYEAIILTVAHQEFLSVDWRNYLKPGGVIYDVKGVLDKHIIDNRL